MARSKWKNKFFNRSVWSTIFDIYLKKNTIKLKKPFYSRSSTVPQCFLHNNIFIHKGKTLKKLFIFKHNVGYKLGEFSFTRKPFFYPKKEVNKIKKR